jgi:NAD(P)-dependent dehydrogenase (short-subunit alcohol dehydrogenase family)
MDSLKDRVCVVTGAASGIGRATARVLAGRGSHLALCDVDRPGLERIVRELGSGRTKVTLHQVDVSNKARMAELPDEVTREHGAVHVVINNAGVAVASTFAQHSIEDFEWLFGINFWGVVYGCKFFLPKLLEGDQAHIVNVSSVFGFTGVPMNGSYCASKFAVRGLTETLRIELSGTNIGVTCVHPGGIATNIAESSRFNDPGSNKLKDLRQQMVNRFKRMLPPEKAGEAIVRAIERNTARLLITPEAYLIDAVKRAFPALSTELVGWRWAKMS